jgi:hypothetical protein
MVEVEFVSSQLLEKKEVPKKSEPSNYSGSSSRERMIYYIHIGIQWLKKLCLRFFCRPAQKGMLEQLTDYYADNGILSTSFSCEFRNSCKGDCKSFTGPKSSFVSSGYADHKLPRLLFLSLDSGSGNADAASRMPKAVQRGEEVERDVHTLNKSRHWYRTHELAWYVLKQFSPDLKIGEAKGYFAHANSAKCSMNKAGSKKADRILFNNCRRYLRPELGLLKPEILITQGKEAKEAILEINGGASKVFDDYSRIITLCGRSVFWLHTYHPSNYGKFNQQRNPDHISGRATGWEYYAEAIYKFISGYPSSDLTDNQVIQRRPEHKPTMPDPNRTEPERKPKRRDPTPTHSSDEPKYMPTMKRALEMMGAVRPDQFSWVAKQGDTHVITIEVDHKVQDRNLYDPKEGTFYKNVPPLRRDIGHHPNTIRHAQQLLDAVLETSRDDKDCKVLLVKGTKSGTTRGGTRAAIEGNYWKVKHVQGTVADGFDFLIFRQST